jgi:putative membrane protein
MFLPALNALLNGSCAIAGLYFIKHHNREAHRTSMLLAFAFSSVFLIRYIVNHALHSDTVFPGHGTVRTLYLSVLARPVILSIVAGPMVVRRVQKPISHQADFKDSETWPAISHAQIFQ